MTDHVHVRNPRWHGAAGTACWTCGVHVEWRECCDSATSDEHLPGCLTFRKRFPVTSRMKLVGKGEDDASTWPEDA